MIETTDTSSGARPDGDSAPAGPGPVAAGPLVSGPQGHEADQAGSLPPGSPQPAAQPAAQSPAAPTLWGLSPIQLHDRYWAARGVQVVRQGEPSEIVDNAELYLLSDSRTLAFFKLNAAVERLTWLEPDVLWVRVHDARERDYREEVISDRDERFVKIRRLYNGAVLRVGRVALTPDRQIARIWQNAPEAVAAWQKLRRGLTRSYRDCMSVQGQVFDRGIESDLARMTRDLMRVWLRPDMTVRRVRRVSSESWADQDAAVDRDARLIGPVWIGAGRSVEMASPVIGPAILWDDPRARPPVEMVQWEEIESADLLAAPRVKVRHASLISRKGKRLFDIAFSAVALLVTAPLYPLIMLAIWFEDGRPFFFLHRRESVGGREFSCIKFRSMRKDADDVKDALASRNQADGPQFYIADDPRLTRVGRLLRKLNLDELPQFINVLAGHMSVIGPRPSPRRENQFCPAWREARLTVRPGITGLWQIRRTRQTGSDFREWIQYDLEYVENVGWRLDLSILWRTIVLFLTGGHRS